MKNILRTFILILFAFLFVGTIVFIYQKSKKKDIVFKTQKPFYTDITRKIVATGKVVPEKEVAIKPKVSGLLSQMYVQAGDYVKKGQAIAKITIIPNMLSLNEAEGREKRALIALMMPNKSLIETLPF